MKIVFKFILAVALPVCVLAGLARPSRAEGVYFSTRDLLADFFRSSERVTFKKIAVGSVERQRLLSRLGYAPEKPSYTFYVASTGGHVDGYALIDDEMGQHLPITFAVKLSPGGMIERQEIVVYREARGDEVRDERFRKQFVGKTAADALGEDVVAISGATISSKAMAVGVRRALVLFDELVRPSQLAAAAAGKPTL